MPKILFVVVEARGHVNPTLAVAAELVRRGADVLFFAPKELGSLVGETGAAVFPYVTTNPFATAFANDFPGWMAHMMREAREVLPQIAVAAKAVAADVVVYDCMAITGRVLKEYLDLPGLMLFTSYAENDKFTIAQNFDYPSDDHPAMARAEADAAEIARSFQVPKPGVKELFGGRVDRRNIVFLPREFQLRSELFDDSFVFVGPSIPPSIRAEWQPSRSGPLAFVSLGTNEREPWPQFFRMCVDAFASSDWQVLMATGHMADPDQLGALPPNMTAVQSAPQVDVLGRADLFVSHGGMASTMESLYSGVPLLVIPQMAEQAVTAQRVSDLGLGRALDRKTLTAESLRDAALAVAADPEIRSRVLEMKRVTRGAGGYERAASVILDYAAETCHGPRAPR